MEVKCAHAKHHMHAYVCTHTTKHNNIHSPLVPRDDTAAFALYEQGAALGDPWSTFTLGCVASQHIYIFVYITSHMYPFSDITQPTTSLVRINHLNYHHHTTNSSWLCQGRGGEEEDWERGFELHLRAAEQFGMPQAAFNVGTHYFSGRGVEQDMGAAATWFERAAAAGMTQAMVNLGNMYLEGLVPPGAAADSDAGAGKAGEWSAGLEAARVWYGRAAEAGDAAGRECLAKCDALERERGEEEEGKGTK